MSHSDNLATLITRYLQVPNVGDTPENKGQCVGLVEVWLDLNGKPHIWGDAKDLLQNTDHGVYSVTSNTPTNYPPPGAIVCWNAGWGAGHGHTAVVIAANPRWLAVFEQNDPEGEPPTVTLHDYSGVLGWITF